MVNFDFVFNVKRFLQGDWLNAGLVIKYWACNKPLVTELAQISQELENALAEGSADALLVKGILIYYHLDKAVGKPDSIAEALAYFKKAAVEGKAMAWQMLGFLYWRGQIKELDYTEVVSNYEAILCREDLPVSERALAANNLGHCYRCGFGVVQNYDTAARYYTQAMELGEINAHSGLGLLCEVAKNYAGAKMHYEISAPLGDAYALDRLGLFYEKGWGVTQSYETAVRYYAQAMKFGEISAFSHLAFCYENGYGVPKNFTNAITCYEKAVNLGDPDAAANLCRLYEGQWTWGSSVTLVLQFDEFAKSVDERRLVNQLTAQILGGNFASLNPETNRFLAVNAHNVAVQILAQLLMMVDYLVQRRAQNEGIDYKLRINDFWGLTHQGLRSKLKFEEYLNQHDFAKKSLHTNNYCDLREGLTKTITAASDTEFCRAAQFYHSYLELRQKQNETETETPTPLQQEVLRKLCNTQVKPYYLCGMSEHSRFSFGGTQELSPVVGLTS